MVCALFSRIDISPAFIAFLCAYYYFDPAQSFTAFLLSSALHEFGHIIALFACKRRIHTIKLRMSGIQIETAPLSYIQEMIVAFAGPSVNFLLLCCFRNRAPLFAFVNFCLLAYNLLPLYPLDGGRIVRCLLHLILPPRFAEVTFKLIGGFCLAVIILTSCYLTCIWHAGLWPVVVSGALLLRLGEMFLKEKRNFAHL